jgi:hypothetical protein
MSVTYGNRFAVHPITKLYSTVIFLFSITMYVNVCDIIEEDDN